MARAVGSMGVVSECGIERNGECGGAGLRDLSGAGADAHYRGTVLSGGAGSGGAGADRWVGAGTGSGTRGAGQVTQPSCSPVWELAGVLSGRFALRSASRWFYGNRSAQGVPAPADNQEP
jgi:hypothetical protein